MNRPMTYDELLAAADALVAKAGTERETEELAGALPASAILIAAARLLDRAVTTLDTSMTPCPTCGERRFNNRSDAKMAEKLAAQAVSIIRTAQHLGGTA